MFRDSTVAVVLIAVVRTRPIQLVMITMRKTTWLAQLVERQPAVREVKDSSPNETGPTLRVLK